MKKFMPVLLFILLFAAGSAEAQTRWGFRIGVVNEEPFIGGDMFVRLGGNFVFNPNIEFGTDSFSTNGDVHYDIPVTRTAVIWLGAGIALVNPEGQDLDVGVNLIGGMGSRLGRSITYVQGKLVAPSSYDNYASLAIGIRF